MKIKFEIRKVDNHKLGIRMYKYAVQVFATYIVKGKKYPCEKFTEGAPSSIINKIVSEFESTGCVTGKNYSNLCLMFHGKVDIETLNDKVENYDEA